MRIRSELGDGEDILPSPRPVPGATAVLWWPGAAQERTHVGMFQREIQGAP